MFTVEGLDELKASLLELRGSLKKLKSLQPELKEANNRFGETYRQRLSEFSPKQVTGKLKDSWQVESSTRGNTASFEPISEARSKKGFAYASSVARGAFGGKIGQTIEAGIFMRGYARSVKSRRHNLWFTFSHNSKSGKWVKGMKVRRIKLAGQPAQNYDIEAFDSMVSTGSLEDYMNSIADLVNFK